MNKKIGLFLDDERNPEDVTWIEYPKDIQWTVVRTVQDFEAHMSSVWYDYVSFDHDIQCYDSEGNEVTGYSLLKSMLEYDGEWLLMKDKVFYFHTQNPVGKENMESYYNNFITFLRDNKCS